MIFLTKLLFQKGKVLEQSCTISDITSSHTLLLDFILFAFGQRNYIVLLNAVFC
jgi:hypothetical protein